MPHATPTRTRLLIAGLLPAMLSAPGIGCKHKAKAAPAAEKPVSAEKSGAHEKPASSEKAAPSETAATEKPASGEKSATSAATPAKSGAVHETWITAVQSCWPAIAKSGRSNPDLEHYLVDPAHFRLVFPSYADLTDAQIKTGLAASIVRSPKANIKTLAHSATPVLTRIQAASGATAEDAVVSSTDGFAPSDSLCSIQTGTPAGF